MFLWMWSDDTHMAEVETPNPPAKITFREILSALRHRKSAAMFVLGMAAGLPYVLITGTLNAWFTSEDISIKTIGVFSWIGILLGFKFLWSPAIDRAAFPATLGMGQRRAGILLLQVLIVLSLGVIAFLEPTTQLGLIAIAAIICTLAFTSQDILIDAWRIEVADETQTIDLLSGVYQIGYRLSAILGGAGALFIAARIGWENTFIALSILMAFCMSGVFLAENSVADRKSREMDANSPSRKARNIALIPVLLGWAWSIYALFSFMAYALSNPDAADAGKFTRETGPIIIFVTIILPVIGAAILHFRFRNTDAARAQQKEGTTPQSVVQSVLNALYSSILVPMMDIVERLRYGAILVLIVALTYRFTDLIWGAFAYPFYLGENYGALGHTFDEVAIASKIFGSMMTAAGIVIGGLVILRVGRMPSLVIGGVLAASTNLLFADLALGAPITDKVLSFLHLYQPLAFIFQPIADFLRLDASINEKLVQLMAVIAAENLSVGFASAAIVVYLSSIANPKYAAVQYALLASLSMLIGTLGRGWFGELIEERGFAFVFYLSAGLGAVAVLATIAEWIRQSRTPQKLPPSAS